MKSAHSKSCETAAERVHSWFGKDKHSLLRPMIGYNQKHFSQTHKCDLVKLPRIPSHIERLPLHGYEIAKNRWDKKKNSKQHHITSSPTLTPTAQQTHCCVNQKYPFHLDIPDELTSERVASWRLKEHFFVSKRLKALAQQMPSGPKRHEIIPIKSSSFSEKKEEKNYWEEWSKVREERHFQIGRIVKYLID